MARHFGMFATSAWDDPDWWELTGEAQRVYMMLVSQSSITPVGTVPMTMKRWANSTKGCTIEGLSKALQELSDRAYVVIDWDREELIVRSFVRWDKGFTNERRLKAIQSAAAVLGSRLLAGVLAHELNRLNLSHTITASPIDALSIALASPIEGLSNPPVSGYVSSYNPEPENETKPGDGRRETDPPDVPSAAAVAAPRSARATRIPADFAITEDMRSWAASKVPGMDIDFTTEKFIYHFQSVSGTRATMIDWVAGWKKWMLGDYKPGNARAAPTGPTRHDENADAVHRMQLREQAMRNGTHQPAVEIGTGR